ncbi:MAG TPA: 4Fe-4S dicluster domain-containing protein [Dehalococcoidia bacterium]|nr:4Fe-4S dicluster domain-containing protein [Dehalococcoidia bacterium]
MKRVYIKEEVCIGCGLCEVYCQIEHSRSKNPLKAFKRETPRPLSRVRVERNIEVSFPIQCRHCIEPWCVYSCLTGALHKESTGDKVIVDMEKCVGCWTCIVACPYGALSRDLNSKTVIKCDLCPGREIPACVINCPNEALVLGLDKERD